MSPKNTRRTSMPMWRSSPMVPATLRWTKSKRARFPNNAKAPGRMAGGFLRKQ
jgi:hypothetical protein